MPLNHFLIVFDLQAQVLVDFQAFGPDIKDATQAYEKKEREYGSLLDLEIVLVGADSRETLEVTHSRYFKSKETEAVPY